MAAVSKKELVHMHAAVVSARARLDELARIMESDEVEDWYLEEMCADYVQQSQRVKWMLVNRGRSDVAADEVGFKSGSFPAAEAPPAQE